MGALLLQTGDNLLLQTGGFLLLQFTGELELSVHDLHIEAAVAFAGSPTTIALCRRQADEYGGAWIKIANVDNNTSFTDFNTASGKLYEYKAIETTAGVSTESIVDSATLTLTRTALHAVTKLSDATNLYGDALSFITLIPHERDELLSSQGYGMAGATQPDVRLGNISMTEIALSALITNADAAVRRQLEALFMTRLYLCLRDTLGNKWFGTMGQHEEDYQATYVSLPIRFSEESFTEALS